MRKQKRWSMADVEAARANGTQAAPAATPRARKFRNQVVRADGQQFDSKGERDRYAELALLAASGAITELKRNVFFVLTPAVDLGEKRRKPALRYKADFTYLEQGQQVVEDFKSDITRKHPVYRIKKHLMMAVHGILIRETKKP